MKLKVWVRTWAGNKWQSELDMNGNLYKNRTKSLNELMIHSIVCSTVYFHYSFIYILFMFIPVHKWRTYTMPWVGAWMMTWAITWSGDERIAWVGICVMVWVRICAMRHLNPAQLLVHAITRTLHLYHYTDSHLWVSISMNKMKKEY